MRTVKLKDKEFGLYIPAARIRESIQRMADEIKRDLHQDNPLFVCIMNGSFMFASELMQALDEGYQVDFARYSSYCGTESTFVLREIMPVTADLRDRVVVIVEDLIDTGYTMSCMKAKFLELGAREVRVAVMLSKPSALKCDVETDYVGMEIENDFIVGHGLDYDDLGRMYPDIYKIIE